MEALVVQMAEENRTWGYRRIQGALFNLGYDLARCTIVEILRRRGIEPAPERSRKTTWQEFLKQLSTRRVEIGGIASNVNGMWMSQTGVTSRTLWRA